jgi:nicotinamidase-related amidase
MSSSKASVTTLPTFYDGANADVWGYRPDTAAIAAEAQSWRKSHGILPVGSDRKIVTVLGIDDQHDFCHKEGSLYVGGSEADTRRFVEFAYREMARITAMWFTLDSHYHIQIFFPVFWLDENDEHPAPGTQIASDEVKSGKWRVNPMVAKDICGGDYMWLQTYAEHYCSQLEQDDRYKLTIWPPHVILGEAGHTLMGVVQELRMFYSYVRGGQSWVEIKGGHPLSENYSVFRPEVLKSHDDRMKLQKNTGFVECLLRSNVVVIGGQAKSHCVAWTIDDFLTEIMAKDPSLVSKVYLLEDCTSPVVIPGILDCTDMGNAAFERFKDAGMHVVQSTTPMEDWPDIDLG